MDWPSRRRLAVTWLVAAAALVAITAWTRATASALDDPDPARQRSGVVADAASAPLAPAALRQRLPGGGVVFFERGSRSGPLCEALQGSTFGWRAVLVTTGEPPPACASVAVADVAARDAARAVRLPLPRDRGAPVGYVILDDAGRVRYATLDPGAAARLGEVRTMLRAATG